MSACTVKKEVVPSDVQALITIQEGEYACTMPLFHALGYCL